MRIEVEVSPKDLAQGISNYWEEFAEFAIELSMWDGRQTVRGKAEAVVKTGRGPHVAKYLRQLADAIDAASTEKEN